MTRARPADAWAHEDLGALDGRGLLRRLEPLASAQGARVRLGGRELVNFSSNDYLGLAGDRRLADAMARCAVEWGSGAGASRLIVGELAPHLALEADVARLLGTEAALVFNSGYHANVGILQALCGPGDVIFSDALNHASIIDGARLSRAGVVVYPHADAAALERLLASTGARRKLVVTDAIFSMDGDHAPLLDIIHSCERHGAALFVDEAHALGVAGPSGEGLCAALGLGERVDVRMGTFGKAAGAFGAFAATSRGVRELLVNRARSFVFTTALPPALCAAAGEGLRILASEAARRARLQANIARFASGLRALGLAAEARSAIFPVVLGSPERALVASDALRGRGLLVKAIRPPTVPEGTSRLRFSLSATHESADVDLALEALEDLHVGRTA